MEGLQNDQAQKFSSFDLQGTLNVRKRTEQIRTIVPEVSSFVGNPVSVKMNKLFERLNSCWYMYCVYVYQ